MVTPEWMSEWPWTAPRPSGPWTTRRRDGFGLLDPESSTVRPVDPADDRKLPGIAAALAGGGEVVSYRHRRRAVVRVDGNYVKVVRPSRVTETVERHRTMSGANDFDAPDVIEATNDGRITMSTVAGTSLHDYLRTGGDVPFDRIAAALCAFHRSPQSDDALTEVRLDDPSRWVEIVARIEPAARRELEAVAATLPDVRVDVGMNGEPGGAAIVHTDLHDKNLMLTSDRVGIIDLDGIGVGPRELDVANLAVHVELRAMQAGRDSSIGRRQAERFIDEYDASNRLDVDRLDALRRHTWFRLACLYRCRRAGRPHVPTMLTRALPG